MGKFIVLKNTCDKNLFISQLSSNYCVGILRKNGTLSVHNAHFLTALNTNRIHKKAKITAQNEFNKKRTERALKREQNEIHAVGNQDAINSSIGHVTPLQQSIAIQGLLTFDLQATEASLVYPYEVYFESCGLVNVKRIWKQREWVAVLQELGDYHCGTIMLDLIKQCMLQKTNKLRLQELLYIQLHILQLTHPKKNKMLVDYFTSTFKENGVATDRMRDKLLLYILVQLLTIDGLKINLQTWAKDLKLPVSELTKAVKQLGCRVNTKLKDAKLVLPLEFPRITR